MYPFLIHLVVCIMKYLINLVYYFKVNISATVHVLLTCLLLFTLYISCCLYQLA